MGRFIQQQIKTLVSRFIPTAWCPSCGNKPQPLSSEKWQKTKENEVVNKKKRTKKIATD